MTQKIPRNPLLHERRHRRKAGPHTPKGKPRDPRVHDLVEWLDELAHERDEEVVEGVDEVVPVPKRGDPIGQ